MRKLFVIFLLIFICLAVISCDNGSASYSHNDLVKVSLFVDNNSIEKSVSIESNLNWGNFTFQYNAVPQWAGNDIQGATNWTSLNYSDGVSLGYFTPGTWIFGVRIYNNQTLIYEGFSSIINISNSSSSVSIMLHKIITEAHISSVSVSISAPTVENDYLDISYNSNSPVRANAVRENGTTTFSYLFEDLQAGNYTFSFTHSYTNAGETISVDLREGEMAVITGNLNNGIWQLSYMTVKIHTISINKNAYGNVHTSTLFYAVNEKVSFSLQPFANSSVQSLSISYVENEITKYVSYTNSGNYYYFIMPDFDVDINVVFREVDVEISVDFFKSLVQGLYNSNNPTKFGRSETPPEVECLAVKDVKVWYDETEDKICWYSSNENTVKFKTGSLAEFFKGCENYLEISLVGLDTSKITSMASLFEDCYLLQEVDFNGINTANVSDMSKMFYHAGYHDFPDWETGTVKEDNTHNHLDNAHELEIKNANFNTGKVVDMSYMFSVCSATDLSGINMSSWDVSKVVDFSFMFAGESVNGKSGWRYWYNKISGFNISNWNTISSTSFKNTFALCNRFIELDISGWKFNNVLYMDRMFERCECLGMVAVQGNAEDDIKLIFPRTTNLNKVQDLLYLFGKDVEFRRENLADIVSTWLIADNPNLVSLFGNNNNTDTNPEAINSNRILANDNLSNTSAHYRKNFKSQVSMTTKDGITLYVGGSGIKGQRLSTNP